MTGKMQAMITQGTVNFLQEGEKENCLTSNVWTVLGSQSRSHQWASTYQHKQRDNKTPHTDSDVKASPFQVLSHGTFTPWE